MGIRLAQFSRGNQRGVTGNRIQFGLIMDRRRALVRVMKTQRATASFGREERTATGRWPTLLRGTVLSATTGGRDHRVVGRPAFPGGDLAGPSAQPGAPQPDARTVQRVFP